MIEVPDQTNSLARRSFFSRLALLAAIGLIVLPVPLLRAQDAPHVTAVDPTSGKVGDQITVTGENLGKNRVSAAFLSDAKTDFKASVVEQSPEKIVMKVPQVPAGDYNVSIQVGNQILIEPFRFTVQ